MSSIPSTTVTSSNGGSKENETSHEKNLSKANDPEAVLNDVDVNDLHTKATFALIFAVAVSCIGSSFIFGYAIGETNVPEKHIQAWMTESHQKLFNSNETTLIWSASVSMFAVGAMIGSFFSGKIADKLGRKSCLHVNNVFAIVGSILMFVAPMTEYYMLFHLGRFIIGINAGIGSSVVPMFVTELAPVKWRGALGTIPQLLVTISILTSNVIGIAFNSPSKWNVIMLMTLYPAILQAICLFFVIESPKWTLMVKGNEEKALKDLAKLRNVSEDDDLLLKEYNLIQKEAEIFKSEPKVGIISCFKGKYLWPTFLACFLQAAQQLSGINAAMFYSTKIFETAGLSGKHATYATLGMGGVNVITTIVSFFLIDRLGRRTLLLTGKFTMLIATVLLVISIKFSWSIPAIIFVFFFVIGFGIGPGSIPFFYVSEVFASNARASASALATATNWTCNFFVGLSFPPLQQILLQYVFLIFTGFLVIAIIVILLWIPETKGKSLDEVNESMDKRKKNRCC